MQNNIIQSLFLSCIFLISCSEPKQITLTKLEGSPSFSDAKLSISSITNEGDKNIFSFDIENYELGTQTNNKFELANSGKGQHIHFIENNGPYSAHYDNEVIKNNDENNKIILAFLSRSYHESLKNPNAYILTQIGDSETYDLSGEFMFYSRPKGSYKGKDIERLLLDFYLVNTTISPDGNKVRVTVNETEFIIDNWSPYYIEGLDKGEVSIKLELIDIDGNLVDIPFNPVTRKVILE